MRMAARERKAEPKPAARQPGGRPGVSPRECGLVRHNVGLDVPQLGLLALAEAQHRQPPRLEHGLAGGGAGRAGVVRVSRCIAVGGRAGGPLNGWWPSVIVPG